MALKYTDYIRITKRTALGELVANLPLPSAPGNWEWVSSGRTALRLVRRFGYLAPTHFAKMGVAAEPSADDVPDSLTIAVGDHWLIADTGDPNSTYLECAQYLCDLVDQRIEYEAALDEKLHTAPSEDVTASAEGDVGEGSLRGRLGEGEDKPADVTLRAGENKFWHVSLEDGRYEWLPISSPADRIRWDYPSAANPFMPLAVCFLDGRPVGQVEYQEEHGNVGYVSERIFGSRSSVALSTLAEAMYELQVSIPWQDK